MLRGVLLCMLMLCLAPSFALEFNTSEALLIHKLLNKYNKELRPLSDEYDNRTLVNLGMTLSQIISVKEKSQEMVTSVYMTSEWIDRRFEWDPRDYEDIKTIRISPEHVWKPDIILRNNKDGFSGVSLMTNVLINYTSGVSWLPPSLYTSSCKIEVSLFPFDWQNCTMVFHSATYDHSEIRYGFSYGSEIYVDEAAFQSNGEWDLIQKPAKINQSPKDPNYQDVTFYFIIKRRPQFYVMNLIIPCILMSSLSCFVFYLPSISCEKITLSISILLGETVFLFLIAQRMPETSFAIPLIAGYLLFCMTLVIISVVTSVFVCNVHFRSNTTHAVPRWVVRFLMEKIAPLLNVERPAVEVEGADESRPRRSSSVSARRAMRERSSRISPSEILFEHQASRMGFRKRHVQGAFGLMELNRDDSTFTIPKIKTIPKSLKSTVDAINYIAEHKKWEDALSQSQDDWAYVALILDRILLWVYCSTFTLGTVGFFFIQTRMAYYPTPDPGTL